MAFALWSDGVDGWERCAKTETDRGWELVGHIHLGASRGGGELDYTAVVDRDWAVASVDVTVGDGRSRSLRRRGDGGWDVDGSDGGDALRGLVDVHLDFSPSLIAPQLRRLDLVPGQDATVDVLHVPLADLRPGRCTTRVAHLDQHHWQFTVDGRVARLHLGAAGLVVEHEAGWTALAVG